MVFPIVVGLSILSIFLLFALSKSGKVLSDFYLIAIILFFMGILSSHILMENWPSVSTYLVVLFFNTYYFPVLVIYGLIVLDGRNSFNKSWLWVYIYPIVYNIFVLVDIFVISEYSTFEEIENLFYSPSNYLLFFYLTQYIYVIVLLIWLWKKIKTYTSKIKNYLSTVEDINLNWFRYFVLSFLGLSCFGFVVFVLYTIGIIKNIEIPFGIEYVIFILLLFYLCYNGIRQYSAVDLKLDYSSSLTKNDQNLSDSVTKYRSSGLSKGDIEFYFNEIKLLFDREEVFLEPQLKIDDLAKKMGISMHKVSQVINSKTSSSFFDFVNGYRVEYFKKLLSDPSNRKFTILSLAIESGFNSKASMNRIFRNFVGQSPKEYQRAQTTLDQ